MRPGDILKAAPIGLWSVVTPRRALTYMRQGFGTPDLESGQMYARIGRGGKLEPVQLFSPTIKECSNKIGAQQDLRQVASPKQMELDLRTFTDADLGDAACSIGY